MDIANTATKIVVMSRPAPERTCQGCGPRPARQAGTDAATTHEPSHRAQQEWTAEHQAELGENGPAMSSTIEIQSCGWPFGIARPASISRANRTPPPRPSPKPRRSRIKPGPDGGCSGPAVGARRATRTRYRTARRSEQASAPKSSR